jgi:hypothetical protein
MKVKKMVIVKSSERYENNQVLSWWGEYLVNWWVGVKSGLMYCLKVITHYASFGPC